jgi:hypothetical protein
VSGDIVERLRDHLHMTPTGEIRLSTGLAELFGVGCVRCEAADEIERLLAERDAIDALHQPEAQFDREWCCVCFTEPWPCKTHVLLHPEEGPS